MLRQHPKIAWGYELFEEYRNGECGRVPGFFEYTIKKSCFSKVSQIYGLEMKYLPEQHLAPECTNMSLNDYVERLLSLDFTKFIVLHRKNYLRQAISIAVGMQTNRWHSHTAIKSAAKVIMDVKAFPTGYQKDSLLELFHCMDKNYKKLKDILFSQKTIFLNYEQDIQKDPRKAYRKICHFLDIEDTHPKIELKRTNPFPLNESIENFDEVKDALENTEYSWMLYDQ